MALHAKVKILCRFRLPKRGREPSIRRPAAASARRFTNALKETFTKLLTGWKNDV